MPTTQRLMTRRELLDELRKSYAYKGAVTKDAIRAFIDQEGIAFQDEKGKDQFDAIWDNLQTKTVHMQCDAGEDVHIHADGDGDGEDGEKDAAGLDQNPSMIGSSGTNRRISARSADARRGLLSSHANADQDQNRGPLHFKTMLATGKIGRKAYQAKINAGTAKFPDVDMAEAWAAAMRLRMLETCPSIKQFYPEDVQAQDREIVGKDGSELSNSLGGALFAFDFRRTLIYLTEPYGIVRMVANMVDMTDGQTIFPRKTGIVTMSHLSQTNAFTNADNTYDNVTLTPKQIGALIYTQRQMFRYAAIDVADDLASTMLEAYWKRADLDWFFGNGTSTYGNQVGLYGYFQGLTTAVVTSSSATWGGMITDDFANVIGTPQNFDPARACWVMSRQFYAQTVVRLASGKGSSYSGGGLRPEDLGHQYIGGTNEAMLLGYKVYFLSDVGSIGANSANPEQAYWLGSPPGSGSNYPCAYFGDFQAAGMFGTRGGLEVRQSEHYRFNYNQIATLGVSDIAVDIHGDGRTGSTGPIVQLRTHS